MNKDLFKGVVVGAIVSSFVLMATSAMAGTGVGAIFNLGKTNKVNAPTSLSGTTSANNLQITNKGTGGGVGITVASGAAPIVVNSTAGKATNLNADKLDGLDSTAFGGVESARITGVPSQGACGSPPCFNLYYGAASGMSSATAGQTNVDSLSPDQAMVARDLSVEVTTPPGTNNAFQVGVDINDAGGATLTCLVVQSATTCTDNSHAVSVPAGSHIEIVVVDNQSGTSFPAEDVLVGFRLTPS